ncbi:MAG: fibronectin type III domain-containing protein [Lachnospiraceae bacterium]|nr:fibronectin type III domain-containing protein [Lachnospiraceae bacterium]
MKKQIERKYVFGIIAISTVMAFQLNSYVTLADNNKSIEESTSLEVTQKDNSQSETSYSDSEIKETASSVTTQKTTTKEPEIVIERPVVSSELVKNKATLSWRAQNGIRGYEVYARQYKKKKFKKVADVTKPSFELGNLKPGCYYNIKVCGYTNVNGVVKKGGFSKPIVVMTNVKLVSAKSLQTATLNISWETSKKADGYEIQYSKKEDFSKSKKKRIANNSADMTNIYELVQNKKYYVRIRTYKTVRKKRIYSMWSKTKKCTIKNADSVINGNFKATDGFFEDSAFFGDSVMLGFGNYIKKKDKGYLDGAKMMGVGSYNLIQALMEDSELHPLYKGKHMAPHKIVKEMKAEKVFLFFGINDVCNVGGLEDTITHYTQFIEKMKKYNPDVEIYIISDTYTLKGSKMYVEFRERLHKLNSYMRTYCADNGYEYIDIASYLANSKGYLKSKYCSDGFLHQTYEAYVIWDKVLRNYAYTKNHSR